MGGLSLNSNPGPRGSNLRFKSRGIGVQTMSLVLGALAVGVVGFPLVSKAQFWGTGQMMGGINSCSSGVTGKVGSAYGSEVDEIEEKIASLKADLKDRKLDLRDLEEDLQRRKGDLTDLRNRFGEVGLSPNSQVFTDVAEHIEGGLSCQDYACAPTSVSCGRRGGGGGGYPVTISDPTNSCYQTVRVVTQPVVQTQPQTVYVSSGSTQPGYVAPQVPPPREPSVTVVAPDPVPEPRTSSYVTCGTGGAPSCVPQPAAITPSAATEPTSSSLSGYGDARSGPEESRPYPIETDEDRRKQREQKKGSGSFLRREYQRPLSWIESLSWAQTAAGGETAGGSGGSTADSPVTTTAAGTSPGTGGEDTKLCPDGRPAQGRSVHPTFFNFCQPCQPGVIKGRICEAQGFEVGPKFKVHDCKAALAEWIHASQDIREMEEKIEKLKREVAQLDQSIRSEKSLRRRAIRESQRDARDGISSTEADCVNCRLHRNGGGGGGSGGGDSNWGSSMMNLVYGLAAGTANAYFNSRAQQYISDNNARLGAATQSVPNFYYGFPYAMGGLYGAIGGGSNGAFSCNPTLGGNSMFGGNMYGNPFMGGLNGNLGLGGFGSLGGGLGFNPYSMMGGVNPYASMMNPYASMMGGVNPYASMMNPYASMMNPYASMMGGVNPYASMMNPYASMMNPYASMMNPYASMMNPYASMMNPYASIGSGLGGSTDMGLQMQLMQQQMSLQMQQQQQVMSRYQSYMASMQTMNGLYSELNSLMSRIQMVQYQMQTGVTVGSGYNSSSIGAGVYGSYPYTNSYSTPYSGTTLSPYTTTTGTGNSSPTYPR